VGIRVLCGFPSEASVSTGLGFSFFFAPFFFLGVSHKKILRQDRLATTIRSVGRPPRYYWLWLAESHLTRRLFGSMVRRIAVLSLPAG
jgi:hypothetical protein